MYGKKAKMQAETGPHSCKPGRAEDRCPDRTAAGPGALGTDAHQELQEARKGSIQSLGRSMVLLAP